MIRKVAFSSVLALSLAACATAPGPVEVTRFVAPDTMAQLGEGTVFVDSVADTDSLELSPFKAAVAAELTRLGYTESARADAQTVAEVRADRYVLAENGTRRGPVSVGVGGSTGSYGSGVGVGVGINLNSLLGGGSRETIGSELAVVLRDKASGTVLWEGRADFAVRDNSPLAQRTASAQTLAAALFDEFPGNNGETIQVEVSE